ncbi:MAG: type III-A CRISPR-associated RAMP protein Csm5 [Cyclobacteriaceae bacterium]
MKPIKLKLKTLTPIAIGDGETISNITDYYIEDSKVHYINQEKIRLFFKANPELIDKFVTITLLSQDNNRSKIHFKNDILLSLMQVNPLDYVSNIVPASGLSDKDKIQIKTIIKTAGRPFIPGSSIKGAIKSAMLYDWLTEIDEGKRFLNDIIKSLNENRFNKSTISNDISKQLKNFAIDAGDEKKFASMLKISDTNCVDSGKIAIYHTSRLHLTNTNRQGNIPIVTEAISPDCELDFFFENAINDYDDVENLMDIVTRFYQSVLWYEWDTLKENRGLKKDHLENLEKKFNLIEWYIQKNEDKMYLRVGSGKSNFNQSIGLALYDIDKAAFKKYRKLLKIGEAESKYFPVTRSIITNTWQQLGWVEIL